MNFKTYLDICDIKNADKAANQLMMSFYVYKKAVTHYGVTDYKTVALRDTLIGEVEMFSIFIGLDTDYVFDILWECYREGYNTKDKVKSFDMSDFIYIYSYFYC